MNLDPQYHLPPGRRMAVDALVSERAHRLSTDLPTFLLPQDLPPVDALSRMICTLATQRVHRCAPGYPQAAFVRCEQLGGP